MVILAIKAGEAFSAGLHILRKNPFNLNMTVKTTNQRQGK